VSECIFCKIVAGDISTERVFENDKYYAFLDKEQTTKGKSLVIPKKHYRWVYDVTNFGEYFETAKKIGLATKKSMDAKWISFFTWGMEVPHAHIHINPHYSFKDSPDPKSIKEFSKDQRLTIANRIFKEAAT